MAVGDKILEIAIEGTGADSTTPDFEAWRLQVDAIADLLAAVDQELHREQLIRWKLVNMHHSYPTLELRPEWADADLRSPPNSVVDIVLGAIGDLRRGRDPEALSHDAIEQLRRALRPIGQLLRRATIKYGELIGELDIEVATALTKVEFKTEVAQEDWEGALEEINVHGDKPTFRLYPAVSRRWITCEIDKDKIEQAQSNLQHKVSVYGQAVYRPKERFPHRVRVEKITRLDDTLESLDNFSGIVPAKEREEMWDKLAVLRNGWES